MGLGSDRLRLSRPRIRRSPWWCRIASRRIGWCNVRVFGSTVRREAAAGSNVDLLVEMESGRSLLDLVSLWQDLESLLGMLVDVLSDGGVSQHLR
jgi:predicted nucleotidyltransferase